MAVRNVFNAEWYMQQYPDVLEAVLQGLISAEDHFNSFGKSEGRAPSPLFDPEFYLQHNPDIAAAVEAGIITAYDHFENFGVHEFRNPVPYFDVDFYSRQNPDIAAAVEQGLISPIEHFLQFGQTEPRALSPFFDLGAYMAANPDVADAVSIGGMSPLDHLLAFGFTEGRDLGNGVSLAQFQNDPVFQAALSVGGNVFAALERVAEVAPFLPTFQPPAGWVPPASTPIPTDFVPPADTTLVIPPTVIVPPGLELPDAFEPAPAPQPPAPEPPVPQPPAPEPPTPPAPKPTFNVKVSTDGDDVTVIQFTGSATGRILMEVDDGVATFKRQNVEASQKISLSSDHLVKIQLEASHKLRVAGEDLHDSNVNFIGPGEVDIENVGIYESAIIEGEARSAHVDVNLYNVVVSNAAARIHTPESAPVIRVNGSEADFIKTTWVYFDNQYYKNWPDSWLESYYDLDFVVAKANLALLYIRFLENNAEPFIDFVAKTSVDGDGNVTRKQWLHDNILGEVTQASLDDRLGGEDRATIKEFYETEAGAFTTRPWVSGEVADRYSEDHKKALAFDYAQDWAPQASDYYVHYASDAQLDAKGVFTKPSGAKEMYMGSGNGITGFTLARHEGEGIEIALKAKQRGAGVDYPTERIDDVVVYEVPSGPGATASWGVPAVWSVDFSVASGLNGLNVSLDDFTFILSIDVDPTVEQKFLDFRLTRPGDLVFKIDDVELDAGRSWVLVDDDNEYVVNDAGIPESWLNYALRDDTEVNQAVSQDSFNIGFKFLRDVLAESEYINKYGDDQTHQQEGFGAGEFDIMLSAYNEHGVLLVGNHIRVDVVETDLA